MYCNYDKVAYTAVAIVGNDTSKRNTLYIQIAEQIPNYLCTRLNIQNCVNRVGQTVLCCRGYSSIRVASKWFQTYMANRYAYHHQLLYGQKAQNKWAEPLNPATHCDPILKSITLGPTGYLGIGHRPWKDSWNRILSMGVSENSAPHCTQWFC